MKKKLAKITSCLLCLAMLLGMAIPAFAARKDDVISMDAPAAAEDSGNAPGLSELPVEDLAVSPLEATGEYEIYPTPQDITYAANGAEVTLPATMKVTYGAGIDDATKARAVEAFAQAGVTLSASASTPVALRVSIDPSVSVTNKYDAYTLTIDAGGVTVVGQHTDAAFYGLTTVKRILQQVSGKKVKHLTMVDYADVPFRGFIEGYYGNPWTVEDREALMAFGGDNKMNIYFYAPKDDPKHSSNWREPYTQAELNTKIKPLAEAGNASKCYYGYALHPFWADGIDYTDEDSYAEGLAALKAKFKQVMDVGVRQIAILADDRGLPAVGATRSYVRLMTDLTNWVKSEEMQTEYPGLKTSIPFCPNDYGGNGSSTQLQDLKALPDSVPVIMTGGQIWGHVEHSFVNTYRTNMGKGPYMWVNWPCSDNSKTSLTMGGHADVLQSDLTDEDVNALQGIMINPMQQSEPSKAGIFQLADYAWNIWNGDDHEARTTKVWDDCFKYIDHNSPLETAESNALRELSKHMIHQNGRVNGTYHKYDESIELAPKVADFQEKLATGGLTLQEITDMSDEFLTLYNAAVRYRGKDSSSGNTRILGQRDGSGYVQQQEQMAPWLDTWVEFTGAAVDLLEALKLDQDNADGSNDYDIVLKYLSAQETLSASKTHKFYYVDHYETAIVGGKYLVPFVDDLMGRVAETAQTILDPSVLTETIITNRGAPSEGNLQTDLRDGKMGTYVSFWSPNSAAVGDYIGIRYNRPVTINSVRFEMGDAGTKNSFTQAKLEYTADGATWQALPGTPTTTMSGSKIATYAQSGFSVSAKGVRLVATAAVTDIYLSIKEIYINGKSGGETDEPTTQAGEKYTVSAITKSDNMSIQAGTLAKAIDGDLSTNVQLAEAPYKGGEESTYDKVPANAWVQVDLGSAQNVSRVVVVQDAGDRMKNGVLEYSTDGSTYTQIAAGLNDDTVTQDTGGITARYIRFKNGNAMADGWVRIAEFSVYAAGNDFAKIAYQSEAVKKIVNPSGTLQADEASLAADNVMLRPGEFVGISLPGPRRVTDIVALYTEQPGLVVKVGMNEAEMKVVNPAASGVAQLAAAEDYGMARYVRLENESEQTISFVLDQLSVAFDEVEVSEGPAFLSTNIPTTNTYYSTQDARALGQTGRWFDGDLTTSALYTTPHREGEYVLYDLGHTQEIHKIDAVISDSANNFVRFGEIQVAPAATGPWTTVVEIASNKTTDDQAGFDDTPLDADWASPYNNMPNTAYKTGIPQIEGNSVEARYLRLYITKTVSSRFPALGEIVINDGAYVSAFNDPTYVADPAEVSADHTPDKMRDGDLTTGFKPDMTKATGGSGSLTYRITEETSLGQINIVQGDAPAKLLVRAAKADTFTEVGDLRTGLNQVKIPESIADVAEVKITWGNVTPIFYEMILVPRAKVAEGGGQASSETETVPINSYSGDARKVNFDENWKFYRGDASGASALVFNDSAWSTVNLPHDYSIDGEYTSAGEAESGYLIGGVGWYRKSFTVDPAWADKTITIDFGGVYMDSEVYLNGTKLGEHHYGYTPFSFVLPKDLLKYDSENVIAVRTNDSFPSSRWYSGAGIYRSVNLTVTDSVHVARYGTKITTTKAAAGNDWTVSVRTSVQNDSAASASVSLTHELFKLDGATYEKTGEAVKREEIAARTVTAGTTGNISHTMTVTNPDLWNSWDMGEPNLYVLVTTVKKGSTVVDTCETEFGFRTAEFTLNDGFKLNGENLKLKGVCQHHDQGPLGAEAWYRALERQVEILMDMGCNSIRVSHNPAADELVEICNRKGVLLIDEAFDGWHKAKNGNSGDFSRWFTQTIADDNALVGKAAGDTWAKFVLQTMIKRDMNAPSVILYSLGNELSEGAGFDNNYAVHATSLINWAKAVDDTRRLTYGQNNRDRDSLKTAVAEKLHAAGGVIGLNYYGSFDPATAHADGWLLVSTETVSHVNSRGVYNIKGSTSLNNDKLLTSYDKSAVSWGTVASDGWWRVIQSDYNAGEYIWTGFDYIGEPTPNNGTGSGWANGADSPKNSFFGAIDTNGLPKDNYWLYRSMWNEKSHTLHILPTWDRSDLVISNGKVEVAVYTDAPMVKLYLNDAEVGSATATTHTTDAGHVYRTFNSGTGAFVSKAVTSHETLYATFNVTYAEGTLRAVACNADGQPLNWVTQGRSSVTTTTGAAKLKATADRATIKNDGKDLSYITIDVVDSKGEIVNGAKDAITVTVEGDGVFMAMDNGVQPDHTSYNSKTRKAGAGQLVAVVQSTKKAGQFTLTATAPGLEPAAVTVKTSGATASATTAPVSYDIARTYYVQLNTEPTLPTLPTTANVTMGNGDVIEGCQIEWNEYDPASLGQIGEFAITGSIIVTGTSYTIPVSVGVVVVDSVAALLNYSAAVRVGQVPVIPDSRPAVTADGTVVNAQFDVTWENWTGVDSEVRAKLFKREGKVVLNGTADVFGKEMSVTATIRVSKGDAIEGSSVSEAATRPTVNGVKADALGNAFDGNAATTWTAAAGDVAHIDFDTAQNLYRIVMKYSGTAPSGDQAATIELEGKPVTVRPVVSGSTATYELGSIHSAVYVDITFPAAATLVDVDLIVATPVFPIGSTAELDGVKLNGIAADEAQVAAKSIKTNSVNAVVTPVSDYNVAVTILSENADSQIIMVTESEDHTARAKYVIQLDAGANPGEDDDSNDYDRTKTTASAPSVQNSSHAAANVTDNDPGTIWHTAWDNTPATNLTSHPENVYIQLTLDTSAELSALRYLPRSSGGNNGIVKGYRVEVSTDGTTWTTAAEGTWPVSSAWKIAEFDEPVTAKYVRLYGTDNVSDQTGLTFMSCAELRVVKAVDESIIDLSEAIMTVEPNKFEWKNRGIRPGTGTEGNATVTVTLRGQELKAGVDYELAYENNIDPGTAYIYARAKDTTKYQGAAATTFTILQPAQVKITSFQPLTVRVQPGVDPTHDLPKTIQASTGAADGQTMLVPVIWDPVPTSCYINPQIHTAELHGRLEDEDLLADDVTEVPTVTLRIAWSQSVDTVSMVTPTGILPALPDQVTVRFDDGTSASRTVSRWYTTNSDKTDLTQLIEGEKIALTAAAFGTAGQTVKVIGDIEGIDRVKAIANVRVAPADTPLAENMALNDSEKTYRTSDNNITAIEDVFPMALAYWSSGNNNPYQAIQGITAGSTNAKERWSDWERDTMHASTWMGVAFETTTSGVVSGTAAQVLDLATRTVNKAKVMFVDENNTGSSAVTYPESYKIQYYTGPITDLTFNTTPSNGEDGEGNGRVKNWTGSPLNDDANWADVTLKAGTTQPAVPTSNGQMLTVEFEPVNTAILRVFCVPKQNSGNKWVGIQALEVYGLGIQTNSTFNATLKLDDQAVTFPATPDADGNYVITRELSVHASGEADQGIPVLSVTADNNASVSVTQATRVPGAAEAGAAWAKAVVTSEDGSTSKTYIVKFTRAGATEGCFIENKIPAASKSKITLSATGGKVNDKISITVKSGYAINDLWVQILDGPRAGELVDVAADLTFLMPAANVEIRANAVLVQYTITYLLDGGSFVGDPRVTYDVETGAFSIPNPSKPGYVFLGWVGGELTHPEADLTIPANSTGHMTLTAVWQSSGSVGGGGGNNTGGSVGGGDVIVPGDVTVTTKNPDGSTTTTTTVVGGAVSAVTTAPDGTQSAVIQLPKTSGSDVDAVMPALEVTADKTPAVTVQNNTGRPTAVTIPVSGSDSIVAIRVNADGTETVIPYSIVDEDGLRIKVEGGDQELKLVDNKKTFDDVPGDHWAAGSVGFVSSRELFNGLGSPATFAPSVVMDRAMMTTVLWRLAEKPDATVVENLFADVQDGAYYEQAVSWGVASGVVKGTDNGFEPNAPITRETLAVMLYRAAGSPTVVDEMPRRFSDGAQVADWAQTAMIWCIQNDILKGYPDNTLGSKNLATRAEVATMLQRFVDHQV